VNAGDIIVVKNLCPVGSSRHQVGEPIVNPDHLATSIARLKCHGANRTIDPWSRPAANDDRHPFVIVRATGTRIHSLSLPRMNDLRNPRAISAQ